MATQSGRPDKLTRLLRRFPDKAKQHVVREVERSSAKILATAQSFVPVDTGALRANLSRSLQQQGLLAKVGIIGARAKRKVYYAGWVEFGTSQRGARPYLRPAIELNRKAILTGMSNALRRAMREVLSG